MKTPRRTIVIALILLTGSIVWAQEKADTKKDVAQLQGEWTMVSGSADGSPVPETMLSDFKRVCKEEETTVTVAGQMFLKAKFKLDASKKPKTIDYDVIDGPTKGKKQLGIYELEGDTFKVCFAKPDMERPTDFKPGEGRTTSVWKREKK